MGTAVNFVVVDRMGFECWCVWGDDQAVGSDLLSHSVSSGGQNWLRRIVRRFIRRCTQHRSELGRSLTCWTKAASATAIASRAYSANSIPTRSESMALKMTRLNRSFCVAVSVATFSARAIPRLRVSGAIVSWADFQEQNAVFNRLRLLRTNSVDYFFSNPLAPLAGMPFLRELNRPRRVVPEAF